MIYMDKCVTGSFHFSQQINCLFCYELKKYRCIFNHIMVNKCSAVYFITQKMIVFLSKPFMQSPVLIHINQYFFSETLNQKVATVNRLFTIPGKVKARIKSISLLYQLLVPVFLLLFLLVSCKGKNKTTGPVYGTTHEIPVPEYRFAIPEFSNPASVIEAYQPLMDYLNKKIKNVKFVLETSSNYSNFEKKYKENGPEFIRPNPWQTIQAIQFGYDVILISGDPADFKGIVVVRKDGGINKPSDLIGKTVSYSSPTAMAAAVMTQYFFYKNGIDINKNLKNIYVGSHESALSNVYLKNSAAAGCTLIPWNDYQRDHPKEASELKVAWETESLIMGSIMIRRNVDSVIRRQVTECLLTLPETAEGRALLESIHTKYFLSGSNKDYDVVKKYVQRFEREVRKIEMK